jgi:hypothetical protein
METKTMILIALAIFAIAIIVYFFTRPKGTEMFSGPAGLASGMSVAGIGPVYENFGKEPKQKEEFCGSCS